MEAQTGRKRPLSLVPFLGSLGRGPWSLFWGLWGEGCSDTHTVKFPSFLCGFHPPRVICIGLALVILNLRQQEFEIRVLAFSSPKQTETDQFSDVLCQLIKLNFIKSSMVLAFS